MWESKNRSPLGTMHFSYKYKQNLVKEYPDQGVDKL